VIGPVLRVGLYAGSALAGVYVANKVRPVQLDASAAIGAAGGGVDTALSDLFHGRFGAAADAFVTGAKTAGGVAQAQVQGQVQMTVILGVVAGCALAGLVEAFFL